MKPYFQDNWTTLYNGDCREVMKTLADCSVDSVVCDPPYELGFMAKHWDRSGIAYDVTVWCECLRVLKPGGHLLAFGGSRTYHRLACAIEDAGFEIRDQIQWIYGSGFPKNLNISNAIDAHLGAASRVIGERPAIPGVAFEQSTPYITGRNTIPITEPATWAAKQWQGFGTALKPAHEPIVLARKPLVGKVAENVLRHGTGALNIDGCRIELNGIEEHATAGSGHIGTDNKIFGFAIQPLNEKQVARAAAGLNPRYEPKGRWPSNICHDGSDEVLTGFPDTESAGHFPRNTGGIGTATGIYGKGNSHPQDERWLKAGSAARFFYCAKASQEDRNEGLEDLPMRSAGEVTDRKDGSAGLNSPRAGAGRNSGSRNPHPTVKPTELMRYLCRLITPPNGLILDPFAGSGSTGKAAAIEGFRTILIEVDPDYCELAKHRVQEPPSLFNPLPREPKPEPAMEQTTLFSEVAQ
jgi:DNA modification methylase